MWATQEVLRDEGERRPCQLYFSAHANFSLSGSEPQAKIQPCVLIYSHFSLKYSTLI
jgi:hypothetical protein